MNQTTRLSLLVRIKDQSDPRAWEQFVDIYGPLIYRFGLRKGLQDADASNLVQDVFGQIAQYIANFNYDPEIGKFRSWLFVVASHALSQSIRKQKRQAVGSGDSNIINVIEQVSAKDENDDVWEMEYREHLFQWACEQTKDQFSDSTWQAFFRTGVDGEQPAAVAAELGISVGAVYIAKSRVTQKLRDKIATVDESI